jgi:hypothetical protein
MHPDETRGGPVTGVTKIRIAAIDAPDLLAEAIELLAAESKELAGFTGGQILLSVDKHTLVILAEWADTHAWSASRYDVRVGKMMEHCHAKSRTMEFELYTRHGATTKKAGD